MNPATRDARADAAAPRRVVVLAYDGVELLDVAGPVNVLTAATRLAGRTPGYAVELAAVRAGDVTTAGGLGLVATRAASSVRGPIDTLIVPGGLAVDDASRALAATIRRLARSSRRVVGICTGAFLLADVGLLDGRRAVSHWAGCAALRDRYPAVTVDADAIFVRDGHVWTSAGVTAGMDLALALVEEDLGAPLAVAVARWLVMYMRRSGGQSQLSAPLEAQSGERAPISELAQWVRAHLAEDLSVPALSRRVGMSPRNFARVFRDEVGAAPAAWVLRVRLEAARSALEISDASVKETAAACGFRSLEAFDRAFRRAFGATPSAGRAGRGTDRRAERRRRAGTDP